MRRDYLFPLIGGIVIGVVVMIFGQFIVKLTNQNARLAQIEAATAQNSQAIAQVVDFINKSTGAQGQAQGGAQTPAPTPAQ